MRTVRDRRVAAPEKVEAMEELLVFGEEGARQLASRLSRDMGTLERAWDSDRAAVVKRFTKRAPKVLDARLGKAERERIEKLRATVVANARSGALTKERVTGSSDPAMAELEELLVVEPNDVYDLDEELFEDVMTLLDEQADAELLFGYWSRAADELTRTRPGRGYLRRMDEPRDPAALDELLLAELADAAALAMPMEDEDREVLERNRALWAELDPGEVQGISKLNHMRLLAGLPALAIDLKLCDASRGHSKDMVELGFFAHQSPVPGKETPGKRAALAGTSGSAENIAAGQRTGEGAIRAWWYSPGHHRNMMGRHRRIGLGRVADHWTQMFGR